VHKRLAPLMFHLCDQYAALEQQEKQRRARLKLTKRRGRLQGYARFMALYWEARAALLLAECEAQCYESRDYPDRVPMGKSALKRLDELQAQFRETKALPRLDHDLSERFEQMRQSCDKLQKRLHAAVSQSYNYSADEVKLWPVAEFNEPQGRKGGGSEEYNNFARELLQQYGERQSGEQSDAIKNALALLEQLYKQDRSATMLAVPRQSSVGSDALSEERQNGVLEERLRWFQKLLSLADPTTNRIVITDCDALRREMAKVETRLGGKR